MKNGKESGIEEIINSLDGTARAQSNPFLAAKIRYRMQQASRTLLPAQWSWRLALVMAAIVLLNIFTIRYILSDHSVKESVGTGTEALAKEYSISIPDSY